MTRSIKGELRLSIALLALLSLNALADPPFDSPHASYYLDSKAGDDSNSGRSPSSAWRTIAKLNSIALSPGDTVYFRRGESMARDVGAGAKAVLSAVRSFSRPTATEPHRSSVAAMS